MPSAACYFISRIIPLQNCMPYIFLFSGTRNKTVTKQNRAVLCFPRFNVTENQLLNFFVGGTARAVCYVF